MVTVRPGRPIRHRPRAVTTAGTTRRVRPQLRRVLTAATIPAAPRAATTAAVAQVATAAATVALAIQAVTVAAATAVEVAAEATAVEAVAAVVTAAAVVTVVAAATAAAVEDIAAEVTGRLIVPVARKRTQGKLLCGSESASSSFKPVRNAEGSPESPVLAFWGGREGKGGEFLRLFFFYQTPLSLPVILKATAAADARGGSKVRRNVAGKLPRKTDWVS